MCFKMKPFERLFRHVGRCYVPYMCWECEALISTCGVLRHLQKYHQKGFFCAIVCVYKYKSIKEWFPADFKSMNTFQVARSESRIDSFVSSRDKTRPTSKMSHDTTTAGLLLKCTTCSVSTHTLRNLANHVRIEGHESRCPVCLKMKPLERLFRHVSRCYAPYVAGSARR